MASIPNSDTDPLIGSTLGTDYRVLERIGMGGMAVVYLVEHQTLLKRFAAKVLSSEHASSVEARTRFTQEAHAASQLDHENIVTISDFGFTNDKRPYFVMELLRGKTLADRIEEGPMSIEEVVAVSVPVARALAHAHAEGIVHRDVKPENIFLVQRSQGRWGVKVLDFGIARVAAADRMTKTDQALGSPMYMAPEACRGEEVDQRADVYSFGIVAYLMLAGRVPFSDQNLLKVLQMQVSTPLPLPSSFNPDLPPGLEAVLIRALAKDPDDRYESMDAFLFDLEAALPEGAEAMLIQAQFGTTTTPFPGALDPARTSARFRGVSLPPFTASPSGRHGAVSLSTPPAMAVVALPTAPIKKRRGPMILATIVVLGGAGGGGYAWMEHSKKGTAVAESSQAPLPAPAPVPTPPPALPETVVAPPPAQPEPVALTAPPEPAAAAANQPPAPRLAPAIEAKRQPPPTKKTGGAAAMKKSSSPGMSAGPSSAVMTSLANPPTPTIVVSAPPDTETPLPAPAPVQVAPPAPVVPPPAPKPVRPAAVPVNIGSLDATPTIGSLDVNGPLPSSVVRRSVERVLPALRTCYKTAAAAQKKTPPLTLSLNFEIDEGGSATSVTASGTSFGTLSSCVRGAIGRLQTQQAPDVGTAQVVVTIKFAPI